MVLVNRVDHSGSEIRIVRAKRKTTSTAERKTGHLSWFDLV
jgi:hypothetical protein